MPLKVRQMRRRVHARSRSLQALVSSLLDVSTLVSRIQYLCAPSSARAQATASTVNGPAAASDGEFLNELAAVVIANNLADAIALEQRGEVVDHGQW